MLNRTPAPGLATNLSPFNSCPHEVGMSFFAFRNLFVALLFCCLVILNGTRLAAQTVSVHTSSGQFANTTVGLSTVTTDLEITNTGSNTLKIASTTLRPSQFLIKSG